ncbi:MAG: DUF460 domain-containing protein [Candidatus Nanohaloarchaea archaeon]
MSEEALIVGIDPGNTSAVAAVGLDGELKLLESSREFPPHKIIRELVETGKPVVVACDTEKMPSTVEKVASSLGARKFIPDEDLESQRKKEMGRGENSHEIDAAASALYAYNNLQRQIQKIDRHTRKSGKDRAIVAHRHFTEGKRSLP